MGGVGENYLNPEEGFESVDNGVLAVLKDIVLELNSAVTKFPKYPTDPLHALAILGEEYGELNKAVLQYTYEPEKTSKEEIRSEAVQTATMALRFLLSLDEYKYEKSNQHSQGF